MKIEGNKTLTFTSEVEEDQTLKGEFQIGSRPDVTEAKCEKASQWRRESVGPSMTETEKYSWDQAQERSLAILVRAVFEEKWNEWEIRKWKSRS